MSRLVYLDTSTLLKRVLAEGASHSSRQWIREAVAIGDVLVTSSLAWIEVARALRQASSRGAAVPVAAIDVALSGVRERRISADVVSLARRLGPDSLPSLDAIHLATAVLLDVDLLVSHDTRLCDAARGLEIATLEP